MNCCARELLEILSNQIHFLSLEQVANFWYPHHPYSQKQAARFVSHLTDQGWVECHCVFCRPLIRATRPILAWRHAEPTPSFLEVSRILSIRANVAPRITTIFRASEKSLAIFGSGRSKSCIKLTQATHDLHVSELFLAYRQTCVDGRLLWLSENALPITWPIRQRPDAVLVDGDGNYFRATEYGGNYSIDRLVDLHFGLASIPLAYEIW